MNGLFGFAVLACCAFLELSLRFSPSRGVGRTANSAEQEFASAGAPLLRSQSSKPCGTGVS
eukprot:14208873-Alexandrium_andersonii.AAC.1